MSKKPLILIATCLVAPVAAFVCCTGGKTLPCDIYEQNGTPCVTAHSTTRQLYSKYSGPLYQVRRITDNKTLDINIVNGYADAAAQDEFCKGAVCQITVIYDQSGKGNDLKQAPPGTFKGPDTGEFNTAPIADMAPVIVNGHKAYGAYIMPGMGLRCNNASGLAINDEAEGIYYVIDGTHYDNGCCFDYGNSSTNGDAVGTGTMETTYFGTSTAWGSGNGDGPWIMSDMEAGLFSGYNPKKNDVPSITWPFVSVYVNGGDGNKWDLRGADATSEEVTTFYSGVRPRTPERSDYFPMSKKGGMLLGNGGDNGNGSAGTFFEGVMTVGYPTDDAINAVQKNIASAKYTKYPVSVGRLTSFVPGQTSSVVVDFENTTGKAVSNFDFAVAVPQGWKVELDKSNMPAKVEAGAHASAIATITAPAGRSAGFADFTANWKGGSSASSQRVRCAEPVKINEVKLSSPDSSTDQFIELYNASDAEVDLSGMNIVIRHSGWASVTAAVLPQGTKIGAKSYFLAGLAQSAVTAPAAKGAQEVYLSTDVAAGANVAIGGESYTIKSKGVPAGERTVLFVPISTGPWLDFPAGATNLPVKSVAGFEVGQAMGIDLGGNYEVVTVTSVGKAATQTLLSEATKAGDTTLKLEVTANLQKGDKLTVSTGARTEIVTVKEVVKVSEPAPARRGFGPAPVHEPGEVTIEEPLKFDHMAKIDVSCPGTGITFTPATKYAHRSGQSVRPLGTAYKLDKGLAADAYAFQAVDVKKPVSGYKGGNADFMYGYAALATAGSIALVDPASGAVVDAIVYGSQQSNSSGNGTITSPELATLEGVQNGGGCIAVVPAAPRFRPGMPVPVEKGPGKSLVRFPDGSDADMLCSDFSLSGLPTPGAQNTKAVE